MKKNKNLNKVYDNTLTENDVEVEVVELISELPGGFEQQSQLLSEPIEIKKTKSKKIVIQDTLLGPNVPLAAIMPNRYCIDCGVKLNADRWRHCNKCVDVLPTDEEYELRLR